MPPNWTLLLLKARPLSTHYVMKIFPSTVCTSKYKRQVSKEPSNDGKIYVGSQALPFKFCLRRANTLRNKR